MTTAIRTGKRAAYPAYKPSGVAWLGNVPEHWEVRRLKYAADLINTKVDGADNDLPYTGLEHIESWTGRRITPNGDGTSEGQANLYRRGDVLFGKLRPYLAKAHAADSDGICTGELLVLRPRDVAQKFLLDYVLNPDFVSVVDSSTYGAKMPRANWDFIGNLPALIPPDNEQRAIAVFLDRETARIDALIEKKRRQIELLQEKRSALISHAVTKGLDPNAPMKDSGIEWLGQIPMHWKLLPLKRVSQLQTGLTLGKKYEDRELVRRPYLRVANVQDGYLDLNTITEVELPAEEVKRYELQRGDVLMTEGGDFDKLGRGYVWDVQIPGCLHQNHIFCVRCDARSLHPLYLAWMTSSSHGKAYFTSTAQQTTNLASTNSFKIKAFPALLPPVGEQEAIIQNVSKNTSQIDALISKVEESAATLREHRSALISAAVTGKIDVRGEVH
ncbi:MAG: restriction endonuclease subunit S [Phycisphaerae bacterium]|nr:restriction endonuclease subunit S [Phycisphaerae bacterium]